MWLLITGLMTIPFSGKITINNPLFWYTNGFRKST